MTRHFRRGGQDYGKLPLKAKDVDALPLQVSVWVPSTKDHKPISPQMFQKRIQETKRKLSSLFGGHTTVRGEGGDGFDEERIAVVTGYGRMKGFPSKKRALIAWVVSRKRAWRQTNIGFSMENDYYATPPFAS